MTKTANKKGFTIVELVIVIAVIAILAAVLIPTFNSVINKANESSAQQKARNALTTFMSQKENGNINDADYFFKITDGSKTYIYKHAKGAQQKSLEKVEATAGTKLTDTDSGAKAVADEYGTDVEVYKSAS